MLLTLVSAIVAAWLVFQPFGGDQSGAESPTEQAPPPASVPGPGGVDGEFLFNYYDQDGDHSPVTGGLGTEALQVLSPVVVARWAINDRWALNTSIGLDQIISASTDNIDDHVSSASRVDQRAFTTVEVAREFETQTVGVSGGFSNEYDYTSVMTGLRWTRDFNRKSTTLVTSGRYYIDQVSLYDIDGINRGSQRRHTADLALSVTQLLGRRTVATIDVGWTAQRGFLSTPFHEVIVAPSPDLPVDHRVAERLPDARDRRAVGVRGNHALTDWLVQRGGYRFYTDTFGISAHSVESETHVRLPASNEMWVYPILRFHRQTGSRYFGLPGTQTIDTEFFTADGDLGRFDSWRYGGGWKWVGAGNTTLGWLPFRSLETRVTFYERSDGLRAVTSSLGVGWAF